MAVPKNPLLAQYKDPTSRALIGQAEQTGDLASKNAMELMNSRGMLYSTSANRAVADAKNQATVGVLPQLQEILRQRQQDAITNQLNRDEFNANNSFRNQQLAMERQRMNQSNQNNLSKWQYEANQNNDAMNLIRSRIGSFRTPGDFDAELQRDVSKGRLDPQMYSMVKEYLMKNYDSSDYELPTWRDRKQKTPSANQLFQRAY